MKTIDRYLISEMFPQFLLGVIGFILIMITDLLFTLTDLIINRGIPFLIILKLLIFKLPAIMVLTYPVSTLFAVTMTLGRLGKDSEITALRTSGINLLRISTPIFVLSLLISMAAFIMNERVVPYTNFVSESLIRQIILKQPLPEVRANVFFKVQGNRYFYVRRIDSKNNRLYDVMVYELGEGSIPRVTTAKEAVLHDGHWVLKNGAVHKYNDDNILKYVASFETLKIMVNENVLNLTTEKTSQEMSARELRGLISSLKESGIETKALAVDFQMKFAIPVTSLLFALIGVPLSLPTLRSGRAWGIVLCVVIVFSYYVLASTFRSLGRGGVLLPVVSAWFPPLILFSLGAVLMIREGLMK